MVLKDGLAPVGPGIAVGVVAALGVGRVFGSLLFEVRPGDPLTLAIVVALLAGVATLACYVPARSSARLDPISAMRAEG
jgi:ABC-type antimicrobial peptide transport system permease subunit